MINSTTANPRLSRPIDDMDAHQRFFFAIKGFSETEIKRPEIHDSNQLKSERVNWIKMHKIQYCEKKALFIRPVDDKNKIDRRIQ